MEKHVAANYCQTVEHPHAVLLQNFVNAILDGEQLIAPGAEGLHSVELANAIVHSSLTGGPVEFPLDSAVWETELIKLITNSKLRPRSVRKVVAIVSELFNR